jgi:hypothetical protein
MTFEFLGSIFASLVRSLTNLQDSEHYVCHVSSCQQGASGQPLKA